MVKPSEILIVGFEAQSNGVVITLNLPTRLKTGNVRNTEFWVSWDKIGDALFADYCQLTDDVDSIREIRKNYFDSKKGGQPMTEKEVKGSFSRFLAYLDSLPLDESQKVQIGSLAMTYKDGYAASQVAKCYKGIITQRELKLVLAAYKAKNASIDEVTQMIMDLAYSKVATKDAEIARKLQIQDDMHQNAEDILKEEIKLLREGILKAVKYIEGPHHSNPEPIAIYEILQSLLSPSDAPLPKCLCSYTYDGRLAKQCDNCRNKPFDPSDGDGETKGNWKEVQASLLELRKELEAENE